MKFDKYENLLVSTDAFEYAFVSEGPKGRFRKIIQFVETTDEGIYNLAFGDLLEDGSVDDLVKNDNKDRDKILATVVYAVYEFTSRYPAFSVFFAGSTPDRTRFKSSESLRSFSGTHGFSYLVRPPGEGNPPIAIGIHPHFLSHIFPALWLGLIY